MLRRLVRYSLVVAVLFGGSAVVGVMSLPWTVQFIVRDVPQIGSGNGSGESTIVAADGSVLATIRPVEQFTPLPGTELPSTLAAVVVATEDIRFYRHRGVDPIGTMRALWRNVTNGGVVEGGSTITQQVMKNDVVGSRRTIVRKVREALLSLRLEQSVEKETILRRYLDVAYYGDGIRGSETVARSWFGVGASELTLGQAALLAAVLPSPARYSPFEYPERAEQRRQTVLDRVAAAGAATPEEISIARQQRPQPRQTLRTTAITSTEHPWVLDTARNEIARLAPSIDLLDGGYQIRTSVNLTLQVDAEKAVEAALQREGMPNGAFVSLDAGTGSITSIVGGADWSASQVNVALGQLGAGSGRQAGSSFKAIALAAALEQGLSLDYLLDAPASIPLPGREPAANYDGRNWGRVSLRTATTWSINTAYLNLTQQIGPENVAKVAQSLGLSSRNLGPEIAIGIDETSPLALAGAYAAFSNGGVWNTPHLIDSIYRNGELAWEPVLESRRAISAETAELVEEALRDVVIRGTATRASIPRLDVSGKTGTTDDYSDAWFTGWAGEIVGSAWVGFTEGRVPMRTVPGWGSISGGSLPAQIWKQAVRDTARGSSDVSNEASPGPSLPPTPELPDPSPSPDPDSSESASPITPPSPEGEPTPSQEPTEGGTPGSDTPASPTPPVATAQPETPNPAEKP